MPAELTQEPPTSGPRWLCRMITPSDTPRVRESCEDYRRIRRIAEARARTRATQGSERYPYAPLAPVFCQSPLRTFTLSSCSDPMSKLRLAP